jgi:hypothetical protein
VFSMLRQFFFDSFVLHGVKLPASASLALGGTGHAPVTCNTNYFFNITCFRCLTGFFNPS